MPYTVSLPPSVTWLAIEFNGLVDDQELLESRAAAAQANAEATRRDFILDFAKVDQLVLQGHTVDRIGDLDRERAPALTGGRCAIVATREVVEIAAKYLVMVSPLDMDYRIFRSRAAAEAWLRGEEEPPPPPPRLPGQKP